MLRKESALKYFNEQKEFIDFRVNNGIKANRKGNAHYIHGCKG